MADNELQDFLGEKPRTRWDRWKWRLAGFWC